MKRLLVLGVLMACGRVPDPMNPAVELELGTASSTGMGFLDMPAAATLVPGAQGGFHVWVSYRIKGASGTVKANHTVRRESDGKLLSRGERKLEVGAVGEGELWESELATPAKFAITFVRFTTTSAAIMRNVGRSPNSSRIRSDRPLPVTAPMREHISWVTISSRVIGSSVHRGR